MLGTRARHSGHVPNALARLRAMASGPFCRRCPGFRGASGSSALVMMGRSGRTPETSRTLTTAGVPLTMRRRSGWLQTEFMSSRARMPLESMNASLREVDDDHLGVAIAEDRVELVAQKGSGGESSSPTGVRR